MNETPAAAPPDVAASTAAQRAALVVIVVLMAGVSVASHQLTPFALIGATGALVVVGRSQLRGLPIVIAVMLGLWISYMTVAFLAGHLVGLLGELGAPTESAGAGVVQRLAGSRMHVFVVQFRLFLTLGFWLLAAAGAIRRFRHGNLDLEAWALAVVPFGLLLFAAYGGELVLRIYLFSLPFMAFMAAGVFLPAARAQSWTNSRVMTVVLAVLLVALLVAKHGNERADVISADELAATNRLYDTAPAGSLLASVHTWGALRYRDLTEFQTIQVPEAILSQDVDALVVQIAAHQTPCSYLLITRSQEAATELSWGYTPRDWRRAIEVIENSGRFREVYRNPDATILTLANESPSCLVGW